MANKEGKGLRNFIWIFAGIILMTVVVMATTIISDTSISSPNGIYIDNINALSRFTEVNLNSGTRASAGLTASNDKRFNVTFGIVSSGFEISGEPVRNVGAIVLAAPAPFYFVNDLDFGWKWISDEDNITGLTNMNNAAELSSRGNFNISGNFSGQQVEVHSDFIRVENEDCVKETHKLVIAVRNSTTTNNEIVVDFRNFTLLVCDKSTVTTEIISTKNG